MAPTAGTVKGTEATVVGCEYEAIIVGVVISLITADEIRASVAVIFQYL